MNRRRMSFLGTVVLLMPAGLASGQTPMGTGFTYQGQLIDSGTPANGQYDFEFKLCDDPGAACTLATTTVEDHPVADGLFTVEIDFGSDVFNGQARWLELGVRPGASAGAYTILTPRQELTPTPYALYADTAHTADDVDDAIASCADVGGCDYTGGVKHFEYLGSVYGTGNIYDNGYVRIQQTQSDNTFQLYCGHPFDCAYVIYWNGVRAPGILTSGQTVSISMALAGDDARFLFAKYMNGMDMLVCDVMSTLGDNSMHFICHDTK